MKYTVYHPTSKGSKINFKYSSPHRGWAEKSFWDQKKQNNKRDRRIKGCESLDQNGTFYRTWINRIKILLTMKHWTPHKSWRSLRWKDIALLHTTDQGQCKNIFLYHRSHQESLLRFLSDIYLCNSLCLLPLHFNSTQLIGKGITTWSNVDFSTFFMI